MNQFFILFTPVESGICYTFIWIHKALTNKKMTNIEITTLRKVLQELDIFAYIVVNYRVPRLESIELQHHTCSGYLTQLRKVTLQKETLLPLGD